MTKVMAWVFPDGNYYIGDALSEENKAKAEYKEIEIEEEPDFN